jgi:hypothetical protein
MAEHGRAWQSMAEHVRGLEMVMKSSQCNVLNILNK